MSTPCLNIVYISFRPRLHHVYTLSTPCLHPVYTLSTPCLHIVYISSTIVYTMSTHCLHPVYTLSTPCFTFVYTLYLLLCFVSLISRSVMFWFVRQNNLLGALWAPFGNPSGVLFTGLSDTLHPLALLGGSRAARSGGREVARCEGSVGTFISKQLLLYIYVPNQVSGSRLCKSNNPNYILDSFTIFHSRRFRMFRSSMWQLSRC